MITHGRLGSGDNENTNIPICISDIKENDIYNKNIKEIDIIEWQEGYAYIAIVVDSEGKAYIWGNASIEILIPTCINDDEDSALFNKILTNYIKNSNGRVWITADGKMYYSEYIVAF